MPKVLQLLPYVVPAIVGGYALIWLALLITCVRKRRFYPVLGDERRTRWFWLATFAFMNPLLTLLYVVFGLRRRPDAQRVRIGATTVGLAVVAIAISGFFLHVPGVTHLWMAPWMGRTDAAGRDGGGSGVNVRAATIEARNTTSSSTTSVSTDHTRLACRAVAIVNESDHPLLRLAGEALREEVEKLPGVVTATLSQAGRFPADGERRPDVFVRLNAGNVRVTSLPYDLSVEAEVRVWAGRTPWRSNCGYSDGTEPPLLDFDWQGTVHHKSRTVGYESRKYGLAAENIAKEIAGPIGKAFRQWLDKHGPEPDWPAALYGTFQPAELPAALRPLGCQRVCSYTGLLVHNETFWRFATAMDANELLGGLRERMKADGWRPYGSGERETRLSKDTRHIHVFRPNERPAVGWVPGPRRQQAAPVPATWYIHDQQRFTASRRRDALEGLLTEQTPLGTLLVVSRLLDPNQRERYYELLERTSCGSLPARVELVHHYLNRKEHDKAERALAAAGAQLWSVTDAGDYSGKLDDAARKLAKARGEPATRAASPKRPAPRPEDFRAAGFLYLDPSGSPVEREVGLDEPVSVFSCKGDDFASAVTVHVSRAERPQPGDPYVLKHLYCEGHMQTWGSMRAWGSQGGRVGPDGVWRVDCPQHHGDGPHVSVRVHSVAGQERFRVTFQRTK